MEKLKKYRADFAFGTYFCDLLNTATANPLINSGDAVLVVYDESPNTIYAGCPVSPIKKGWTRKEFKDFEAHQMNNIVKYIVKYI